MIAKGLKLSSLRLNKKESPEQGGMSLGHLHRISHIKNTDLVKHFKELCTGLMNGADDRPSTMSKCTHEADALISR